MLNPHAENDVAYEHLARAICDSYSLLMETQDFSPTNPDVNQSLSKLVSTLKCAQRNGLTLESLTSIYNLAAEKKSLPDLCARAECEMEKYWAKRLLETDASIETFWYLDEYRLLCADEAALIKDEKYKTITFLGSGALPLTAIIMADIFPDAHIQCLDFDDEACRLSCQLIKKLSLENRISVRQENAAVYQPSEGELIVCASLLRDADAIFSAANQVQGCDLMVRNSENLYQFLYRQSVLPDSRFSEVRKTALSEKRINTSHFYKANAAPRA